MGNAGVVHGATALLASLLVWLAPSPASAQSTDQCPWLDASASPSSRAEQLVAAMTLDEKVRLTYGSASQYGFASEVPANERLCMPAFVQSDGPAGIAGGFGGTQQGVTAFPVGMAQAATWDPALNRRLGRSMGEEARDKGANVLLAPALNINRVPQNGRNFEYFGEDPFLSARTTVAQVRGIQTNPVVATLKHYAANNQETERGTISAEVEERTLREIYLRAFEAGVTEGRAGSVMCAYNRLNGTYACEHPWLLTEVLKDQWGFDGWVMSDWLATHSTTEAALAGLDQEQNGFGAMHYGDDLKAAVEAGEVPMSRLDDMVLRILRSAFRMGLFERRAAPQPGAYSSNVSTAEHQRVALEVGTEGSVLLKNADGLLPLDGIAAGTRIAVIGRPASQPGATSAAAGSGSAHVNDVPVEPLSAIRERAAAEQAAVTYAEGDTGADAAAAAAAADIAIVFVRDLTGEGNDRPGMSINDGACVVIFCAETPRDQDELITSVAEANPNTVVVALTGGPVLMPWLADVKGVLEMWYPGRAYGTAVATLLFGDTNPSGKLPQTFPAAVDDMPFRSPALYPGEEGKVHYSEGLQVGYRWYDAQGIQPLFPFGFGLSYTTFSLDNLRVRPAPEGEAGATVRVDVANAGNRDGAEIPQVYVGFPEATGEPPKQLKGFKKVFLESGERKTVRIPLDDGAFSYWDAAADDWRVAPGCYRIMVGTSSRHIARRTTLALGGARCPRAGDGHAACLPRHGRVRRRRVGPIRLHQRQGRIEKRLGDPSKATARASRYCVRGGGEVRIGFGAVRRRARLIAATARGYRTRGIGRGSTVNALRRAYPGLRKIRRGLYASTRTQRRAFGVRRDRIQFVAVADRRLARNRDALLRYLRVVGLRR